MSRIQSTLGNTEATIESEFGSKYENVKIVSDDLKKDTDDDALTKSSINIVAKNIDAIKQHGSIAMSGSNHVIVKDTDYQAESKDVIYVISTSKVGATDIEIKTPKNPENKEYFLVSYIERQGSSTAKVNDSSTITDLGEDWDTSSSPIYGQLLYWIYDGSKWDYSILYRIKDTNLTWNEKTKDFLKKDDAKIENLKDVDWGTPSNGQVLEYTDGKLKFVYNSGGGGSGSINTSGLAKTDGSNINVSLYQNKLDIIPKTDADTKYALASAISNLETTTNVNTKVATKNSLFMDDSSFTTFGNRKWKVNDILIFRGYTFAIKAIPSESPDHLSSINSLSSYYTLISTPHKYRTWQSGDYKPFPGEIVFYNDSYWKCIKAAADTVTPGNDNTVWQYFNNDDKLGDVIRLDGGKLITSSGYTIASNRNIVSYINGTFKLSDGTEVLKPDSKSNMPIELSTQTSGKFFVRKADGSLPTGIDSSKVWSLTDQQTALGGTAPSGKNHIELPVGVLSFGLAGAGGGGSHWGSNNGSDGGNTTFNSVIATGGRGGMAENNHGSSRDGQPPITVTATNSAIIRYGHGAKGGQGSAESDFYGRSGNEGEYGNLVIFRKKLDAGFTGDFVIGTGGTGGMSTDSTPVKQGQDGEPGSIQVQYKTGTDIIGSSSSSVDTSNLAEKDGGNITNPTQWVNKLKNTLDNNYQSKGSYLTSIANDYITTGMIKDKNITTAKLADNVLQGYKKPGDIELKNIKDFNGKTLTNDYIVAYDSSIGGFKLIPQPSGSGSSSAPANMMKYDLSNITVAGKATLRRLSPAHPIVKGTDFTITNKDTVFFETVSGMSKDITITPPSNPNDKDYFQLIFFHKAGDKKAYLSINGGQTDMDPYLGLRLHYEYDANASLWVQTQLYRTMYTDAAWDAANKDYLKISAANVKFATQIVKNDSEWSTTGGTPIPANVKAMTKGSLLQWNGNLYSVNKDGVNLEQAPDLQPADYNLLIPNKHASWSSSYTKYAKGELVFHNNTWWRCKSNAINIEPSASNTINWEKYEGVGNHEDWLRWDGGKIWANSGNEITISTSMIDSNAITTAKIKDKNITAAKLADGVLSGIDAGTGWSTIINDDHSLEKDKLYWLYLTTSSTGTYNLTLPSSPSNNDTLYVILNEKNGSGKFRIKGKVNNTTDYDVKVSDYKKVLKLQYFTGSDWSLIELIDWTKTVAQNIDISDLAKKDASNANVSDWQTKLKIPADTATALSGKLNNPASGYTNVTADSTNDLFKGNTQITGSGDGDIPRTIADLRTKGQKALFDNKEVVVKNGSNYLSLTPASGGGFTTKQATSKDSILSTATGNDGKSTDNKIYTSVGEPLLIPTKLEMDNEFKLYTKTNDLDNDIGTMGYIKSAPTPNLSAYAKRDGKQNNLTNIPDWRTRLDVFSKGEVNTEIQQAVIHRDDIVKFTTYDLQETGNITGLQPFSIVNSCYSMIAKGMTYDTDEKIYAVNTEHALGDASKKLTLTFGIFVPDDYTSNIINLKNTSIKGENLDGVAMTDKNSNPVHFRIKQKDAGSFKNVSIQSFGLTGTLPKHNDVTYDTVIMITIQCEQGTLHNKNRLGFELHLMQQISGGANTTADSLPFFVYSKQGWHVADDTYINPLKYSNKLLVDKANTKLDNITSDGETVIKDKAKELDIQDLNNVTFTNLANDHFLGVDNAGNVTNIAARLLGLRDVSGTPANGKRYALKYNSFGFGSFTLDEIKFSSGGGGSGGISNPDRFYASVQTDGSTQLRNMTVSNYQMSAWNKLRLFTTNSKKGFLSAKAADLTGTINTIPRISEYVGTSIGYNLTSINLQSGTYLVALLGFGFNGGSQPNNYIFAVSCSNSNLSRLGTVSIKVPGSSANSMTNMQNLFGWHSWASYSTIATVVVDDMKTGVLDIWFYGDAWFVPVGWLQIIKIG